MAELAPEVKTFIVIALARRKSPSEIVDDVKEQFGNDVEVTRQQVRSYNPEQCQVAETWKLLWDQERKAFDADVKSIPIAHQSYRLQKLQTLVDKNPKNSLLVKDLLEQAAKEVGGAYTNKRNININPREALADFLGVDPNELPEESKA